ncbi:MAG TPA: hypothetical protein ENK18_16455, partial [Deltaproteobacteria bacterium]|nr:hypothetical protein [Deltaproteobacteria bacterium]
MRVFSVVFVACHGGGVLDRVPDPSLGGGDLGPGIAVQLQVTEGIECTDPQPRDQIQMDTELLPTSGPQGGWTWGAGVIAGDFDGDGLVDLFLPGLWGAQLFRGHP